MSASATVNTEEFNQATLSEVVDDVRLESTRQAFLLPSKMFMWFAVAVMIAVMYYGRGYRYVFISPMGSKIAIVLAAFAVLGIVAAIIHHKRATKGKVTQSIKYTWDNL